jgi:hypothetical protein
MMRGPSIIQRLQLEQIAQVAAWNQRYPVGTEVTVKLDSGEVRDTRTRSEAQMLGAEPSKNNPGHTAVIWLVGISGCYLLSRVSAVA